MTRSGGGPGEGSVVEAREGSLEGLVSHNSVTGEDLELTYTLRLVLPPEARGAGGETSKIKVHRLKLGDRTWRDLPGGRFDLANRVRLAVEPSAMGDPGLADGTLETAGEHQILQVESLTFGEMAGGELPVDASFRLDPEAGSAGERLRVTARVSLGPVVIRGDRNRRRPPGRKEARRLAATVLDLDDYVADRRDDAIAYRPRVSGS